MIMNHRGTGYKSKLPPQVLIPAAKTLCPLGGGQDQTTAQMVNFN